MRAFTLQPGPVVGLVLSGLSLAALAFRAEPATAGDSLGGTLCLHAGSEPGMDPRSDPKWSGEACFADAGEVRKGFKIDLTAGNVSKAGELALLIESLKLEFIDSDKGELQLELGADPGDANGQCWAVEVPVHGNVSPTGPTNPTPDPADEDDLVCLEIDAWAIQ